MVHWMVSQQETIIPQLVGCGGSTSNTTGTNNTFIGSAGEQIINRNDNTFIGYGQGTQNRAGAYSTIIGSHAGYQPSGATYSGSYNLIAGYTWLPHWW